MIKKEGNGWKEGREEIRKMMGKGANCKFVFVCLV